jgi:dihydrodipicolinate synthase/N-acetylneuraminate lyase
MFYPALCAGAAGGILALASVVPETCRRLFDLVRAGRHAEARVVQRQLIPLARLLGPSYGVPGLKAALRIVGYDVGLPRPPLVPVADAAIAALKETLAQFEEIPA